jgi:hypothetical protein
MPKRFSHNVLCSRRFAEHALWPGKKTSDCFFNRMKKLLPMNRTSHLFSIKQVLCSLLTPAVFMLAVAASDWIVAQSTNVTRPVVAASAAHQEETRDTARVAPQRKPNVIFILTDDQGWGDARFAGHPYVKTPHLDRLASESTWFGQFYVASTVCSPSRVAFMTSHYPARHHVHGHFADHEQNQARSMPNWLDPNVTTLADLLQTAGYTTAHFESQQRCQRANKGVRSLFLASYVLEDVRVGVRSIRARSGEQLTQPMLRFQMDFHV